MKETNNVSDINTPNFEEFYNVISSYVEYCLRKTKTYLENNNEKEDTTSNSGNLNNENNLDYKSFQKQKKLFQNKFNFMCSTILDGNITYLNAYIDATKKLYDEKNDWKREIKAMLVSSKSLELFRNYRRNLVELYPLLVKVNSIFPIDDYYELSLAPEAALYGSIVNQSQKGSVKKSPLDNDEIQEMLNVFLIREDMVSLGRWLMAILCFDSSHLVGDFQNYFVSKRNNLRKWAYEQILVKDKYRYAIMDFLAEKNKLKNILDVYLQKPQFQEKIKKLEESNSKFRISNNELRNNIDTLNKKCDTNMSRLEKLESDFERCKHQLDDTMNKYHAQIAINERVVLENERMIYDIKVERDSIQDELDKIKSQLASINETYYALQSDYTLKNNEFLKLKNNLEQKEKNAKIDVMKDLVSGINEQFYYLTLFYLELKDYGRLSQETIGLYADALSEIDNVLSKLGIKKMGVIEQKTTYDAAIHNSSGIKIANGEEVIVKGYGWKIGDEVYIKIPVEKGE